MYEDIWALTVGESLLVKPEPTNPNNKKAVAVLKDATIVGHVQKKTLLQDSSCFLRRDVNKAFAEVTGERVNTGAGYGLEVPCTYRLYGPQVCIDRMKQLVDELVIAGHL